MDPTYGRNYPIDAKSCRVVTYVKIFTTMCPNDARFKAYPNVPRAAVELEDKINTWIGAMNTLHYHDHFEVVSVDVDMKIQDLPDHLGAIYHYIGTIHYRVMECVEYINSLTNDSEAEYEEALEQIAMER